MNNEIQDFAEGEWKAVSDYSDTLVLLLLLEPGD